MVRRYGARFSVLVILLLALPACTTVYHASIELGDEQRLTDLYSYPNQPGGSETLADTVKHYLAQTADRDGLHDATVNMRIEGTQYAAVISSSSADVRRYSSRVPAFLSIGELAFAGAQALEKTPIWQDDWRFFLPLGLAMTQQYSVQLLHFPPDYSLPDQNYLGSKTSERWESLLELNGVAGTEVARYETIIDIAPIAAPASDGAKLEGSYAYFSQYAHELLSLLTKSQSSHAAVRSVVAYGSPVHQWVETQFGVKLDVLGTGYLALDGQIKAPVLGANHPSYFWYAAEQSCDKGWQVMREDLIAARWQILMAASPAPKAAAAKANATTYWDDRTGVICAQTRKQSKDCESKPIQYCSPAG